MKQFLTAFVIAAVVLTSCENKQASPHKVVAATHLSASSIYNADTVIRYLAGLKMSQQDTGKKIFLQAIDLLKNKKDAAGSVALFESSLSFYPDNKTYYELGNALLEVKRDSLAFQAFAMAEKLNYNPLSYILYKKACALAASSREDDWESRQSALQYLQHAIENGFVDREKIFNDPFLEKIRNSPEFVATYNDAMSGNGDPASILWEGYSNSFKQCSYPLSINMETLKRIKSPQSIGYDYEKYVSEMRDYKFSRDVGNEFFYYAKVASTPAFETVIYGSRSYDYGENLPYVPARFYIASYSMKGKLLDKLELAGQAAFDQIFKVAVLQENLDFEIKEFQNSWKKPTGDNGYENNAIAKSVLLKTSRYKIGPDGKFVGDAPLLGSLPGSPGETLQ